MQKILAIDDKRDNLVTLSAMLNNLMPGCVVITAQSGREGIEKAMAELPDVILLDIIMPDMDGFETCRRLMSDESTKNIPVIMITAIKTDQQSRIKGLDIGANAFLAKPINEYELVSQVNVALRIKKAEDDLREERRSLERTVQERTATLREEINERMRAEEEKRFLLERLQRAEKMEALGQLAGGVAHDLNNILGILSGYSELLLEEIPEGHQSRVHVEKILQSTEKGAKIIQDLLTLARRGVTVSDVINLNGIVSDFLKSPFLEKVKDFHPRVTFIKEYDKNLLNIKGSPIHLEKTLMNLVSNAAEAISGEGKVTIRTESRHLDKPVRGYDEIKEGDYAVLTVSDTGIGIPAENREKIFEPFYTKKIMGRSGTGLGLAIVWGTVKDHHGYIDVQTEVGEGTTFSLFFPVTKEELIAQQKKTPIEQYMGRGESVLVTDDIAEQRDIAARLLTRLGYSVRVVSSGEEAVEYLKGNDADILVLDMIMAPGIDGLETYQRILKINPKQKAILVSGFSETERVREAQKLGAGAYIKKPYVMEKIGMAIRDELIRG
jgi:two-component system cell cycle sensor histidine kinase/response regulator CckA